jgi:hypothetical protein
MSIDFESYMVINWQYLEWKHLTPEQHQLFDSQGYHDESCTLRYTGIPKAMAEVEKALSSRNFKKEQMGALSESVTRACLNAFSSSLENLGGYHNNPSQTIKHCVVSLRVAVRVQTLAKKIMAGESLKKVFEPYRIQKKGQFPQYADYALYFKTEAEFRTELAKLSLAKSPEIFARSSKECYNFLKTLHGLGFHSKEELCMFAFDLVKKKDYPEHYVTELLQNFSDWKEALCAVLVENMQSVSWLVEKNVLAIVKKKLPEYSMRLDELENEHLRLKKETAALKVDIEGNEILALARSLWKRVNPAAIEPKAQENDDLPPELSCSITGEVMNDPVIDDAGMVYERAAIELWLKEHDTDPLTRHPISKKVIPVYPMKSLIQSLLKQK